MARQCALCGKTISEIQYYQEEKENIFYCSKCGKKIMAKYLSKSKGGRWLVTVIDMPHPYYTTFKPRDKEENFDKQLAEMWSKECKKAMGEPTKDQEAKADDGKPILSLVPKQIVYEIEKVRRYGVEKYKDPDNWKRVEIERYHQALLRHTLAVWDDIAARDKESGLLHLSHIATNVAFMLEMMKDNE